MARGPDGNVLDPGPIPSAGEELALAIGLEKIIDRAMARLGSGERFVYGIHQELPPAVAEHIVRRYREAGWSDVRLKPGETGAWLLVLQP
jgi:hypothetical protein